MIQIMVERKADRGRLKLQSLKDYPLRFASCSPLSSTFSLYTSYAGLI
jgi:hypothetical protein